MIRAESDRTIAGLSAEHLAGNRSTGTLVHSDDTPYLAPVIPDYRGDAEPMEFNRFPGPDLR